MVYGVKREAFEGEKGVRLNVTEVSYVFGKYSKHKHKKTTEEAESKVSFLTQTTGQK